VSLAVALYTVVGAAGTMRVMDRADCQVMEECLRRTGHRGVRVESGLVVMAGREVVAVLECVTNGGMAFTWKYPLGQMDNVTAGRVLGGLK
jgi:hypothetical protein